MEVTYWVIESLSLTAVQIAINISVTPHFDLIVDSEYKHLIFQLYSNILARTIISEK